MGQWNFADSMGSSFDDGANLALKKRQMAFERIKQTYEMHKQAYDEAQKVINDPATPNSRKLMYYNQAVVPYSKTFMGVTLPALSKWNSDVQDAAEMAMTHISRVNSGQETPKEAQLNLMGIKADFANTPGVKEAMAPMDQLLDYKLNHVTKEVTAGGQKGTAIDNGDGTYKWATVNGQQASGPTAESITAEQNKQQNVNDLTKQWLDAAKLISDSKEPGFADILEHLIPGFKGMSPEDQAAKEQEAINNAHSAMYMIGGRLGVKADDVTNVLTGKKSAAELMNRVGKNFKIDGANNPAPPTNLPGLTIQPKAPTISEAPTGAAPDATMAQAPAPTPDAGAAPAPQLADNSSNPTDQEEANV